jgi:hypothetical protein
MFITKNNYADFKSVGKNKKNAQTSFTNAGSAVEGGWGRASQGEFRIFLEQLLGKFLKSLRCTFLRTYGVHCNTYTIGPSFN